MEDIQKLSIDIMDDKVFEPIYTKQYDQGRKVYVTVLRLCLRTRIELTKR